MDLTPTKTPRAPLNLQVSSVADPASRSDAPTQASAAQIPVHGQPQAQPAVAVPEKRPGSSLESALRKKTPAVVSEVHHEKMLAMAKALRVQPTVAIDPIERDDKKREAFEQTEKLVADLDKLQSEVTAIVKNLGHPTTQENMAKKIGLYLTEQPRPGGQLDTLQQAHQKRFEEMRERIVPDIDAKITRHWQEIVLNDARDSATPMDDAKQVTELDLYRLSVRDWLQDIRSLQQIARQNFQREWHAVTPLDMKPGMQMIRKEVLPKSAAHARTLNFQLPANHNGIADNKGDTNDFHAAVWIGEPLTPAIEQIALQYDINLAQVPPAAVLPMLVEEVRDILNTGRETTLPVERMLKQIGEARGGKGTTNAMRVLNHAVQDGDYWIYQDEITDAQQEKSDDVRHGEAVATISEMLEGLTYSATVLGATMYSDDRFRELDSGAKKDIKKNVTDLAARSQLGITHETARYSEQRTRENNHAGSGARKKGVTRVGGESCSSYLVRLSQSAALQMALYKNMEQHVRNFDRDHDLDRTAGLSDDVTKEKMKLVRSKMNEKFAPNEDGSLNRHVEEFLDQEIEKLTGLADNSAEGVSPRTVEHFCRDQKFVGVLTIDRTSVFAAEERFDADRKSKSGGNAFHIYRERNRSPAGLIKAPTPQ